MVPSIRFLIHGRLLSWLNNTLNTFTITKNAATTMNHYSKSTWGEYAS